MISIFSGLPILIVLETFYLITNPKEIKYPYILGMPLCLFFSIIFTFGLLNNATGESGLGLIIYVPYLLINSLIVGFFISKFYKSINKTIIPRTLKAITCFAIILLLALSTLLIHIELPHKGVILESVSNKPIPQVLVRQALDYECMLSFNKFGKSVEFMGYAETLSDSGGEYFLPFQIYFKYPFFCWGGGDSLEFLKAGYFTNISPPSDKKTVLYKANHLLDFNELTQEYHFTPKKYSDEISGRSKLAEKAVQAAKNLYPLPDGEVGVFLSVPDKQFTELYRSFDKEVYGSEIFYAFDEKTKTWLAFDKRGMLLNDKNTGNIIRTNINNEEYDKTLNFYESGYKKIFRLEKANNTVSIPSGISDLNIKSIQSLLWSSDKMFLYVTDGTDKIYRFDSSGKYDFIVNIIEKPLSEITVKKAYSRHLFRAARTNDLKLVKMLIEAGADPNIKDQHGYTPLYFARRYSSPASEPARRKSYLEIISFLLNHGADPSIKDQNGVPMLRFLDIQDSPELLRVMVENSVDPDVLYKDAENQLISCVKSDRSSNTTPCVQVLLTAGVNPNSKTFADQYPLWIAVENMDLRMVELLLANGADAKIKNEHGQSLLWAILSTLPYPQNKTKLEGILDLLFANGVRLNTRDNNGDTILSWAEKSGHGDKIQLLHSLDNKYSQLNVLVQRGDVNLLQAYFENKKAPDNLQINYALRDAVGSGNNAVVEILLKNGADPNNLNDLGQTCLWKVAEKLDVEMLTLLLKYGLRADIVDNYGTTVLWEIINNRSQKRFVFDNPHARIAGIDGKGKAYSIDVTRASSPEPEIEFVKILINNGLDLSARDQNGLTANIYASTHDNNTLAQFLSK